MSPEKGLPLGLARSRCRAQMAADPGMLRVELYIDGHPMRTLGAAMIEPFGNSADGWLRVVHRDAGLRELGKQLDRGRL
jgi:hypothetical protein